MRQMVLCGFPALMLCFFAALLTNSTVHFTFQAEMTKSAKSIKTPCNMVLLFTAEATQDLLKMHIYSI